jgi:MoaE-MoaD fusion protein
MRVTVLYFAAARERAQTSRETVDVPANASVATLLELLATAHAELRPLLKHLRVAVNQRFVSTDETLVEGAEVALIPPVSGGLGHFYLSRKPLSLDDVVSAVSHPSRGALVTFTGNVRDQTSGKRVMRLEYEAYDAMAVTTFLSIEKQVLEKWPQAAVSLGHRLGTLTPGETAVVIAAASPHRKEAFEACSYVLERLKTDVPIWKKEFFEDAAVWVGL